MKLKLRTWDLFSPHTQNNIKNFFKTFKQELFSKHNRKVSRSKDVNEVSIEFAVQIELEVEIEPFILKI